MAKRFKDETMQTVISRVLRSQMVSEGITYEDLAQRLEQAGVAQNPSTLRTKVCDGSLGAPLLIHLLSALNLDELDICAMVNKYNELKSESESD